MRLKKLQISGFKSFVDTTDVRLPDQLTGVVGPNGGGKSNVIDAVRWVMGESSAKTLRGDNMEDVIFNGSTVRKPVSKASVELIFDNNDGKVPDIYGQFSEIAIKRSLTRDGQSLFSINNIKTRRKDVLDFFRGTGLGARSYSIMEQGMVSRIVEARPEDLRNFIEEAAGTAKYKDKRRETENKIANTRDNLERVADIRDELAKQLRKLKRQSTSAQRYKALKGEQDKINGQLLYLKRADLETQLRQQDRLTAAAENTQQAALANQTEIELHIESIRQKQSEAQEASNQDQQALYKVEAQISNIEQNIEHQKEIERRRNDEIDRLLANQTTLEQQIKTETETGTELKAQLDVMLPELERLMKQSEETTKALSHTEAVRDEWQVEMDKFNLDAQQPIQQMEVQKSRIDYLQRQIQRASENKSNYLSQQLQLQQQIKSSNVETLRVEVGLHDERYQELENEIQGVERQLKEVNLNIEKKRTEANQLNAQYNEVFSRFKSLQEIQQAVLNQGDEELERWQAQNLAVKEDRLARKIQVAEGWERAADRVLDDLSGAICAPKITSNMLSNRPKGGFSLFTLEGGRHICSRLKLSTLASKVKTKDVDLDPVLSGIYLAESLDEALALKHQLQGNEYIVTKAGEVVGVNWFKFASQSQLETGTMVREEEIHQLKKKVDTLQLQTDGIEREIALLENSRTELGQQLFRKSETLNTLRAEVSTLQNNFTREDALYRETEDQLIKLKAQIKEIEEDISKDSTELTNAQTLLQNATEKADSFEQKRATLNDKKKDLSEQVSQNREQVMATRDTFHHKQLAKQQLEAQMHTTRETLKRVKVELQSTEDRLFELCEVHADPVATIFELETEIESLLNTKLQAAKLFASSKEDLLTLENQLSQKKSERSRLIDQVDACRKNLSQENLKKQELLVRKENLDELIIEQNDQLDQFADGLPTEADIPTWQEKLKEIEIRVVRIGPVNLVAIEEFDVESKRMAYLDKQHRDLTEALDILESAIRKIDKETRSRFKNTFDEINTKFKEFFPQLFGGGNAELRMTSDDLLTTGISVMAQPPGKRNSHIHLLSGGEKALTAVALLFSLFKLNPAPFCMLDEVDAPLDDANVERYCETLKSLAKISQLIVITHNKITMEAMNNLVGITMAEAGISRLVSVDINEAVRLAV